MKSLFHKRLAIALLLACCIVIGCSKSKEAPVKKSGNTTAVTDTSYTFIYSGNPFPGDTVYFTSIPSGRSFLWQFEAGIVSSDAIPYHIYPAAGIYTVTLLMNNDTTDMISQQINIYEKRLSYTHLITGTKLWHHTADITVMSSHTTAIDPDTTLPIYYISPTEISFFNDTLTYNKSISSDSNIVFIGQYLGNLGYGILYLHYNHYTSGISCKAEMSGVSHDVIDWFYTP